MDRSHVIQDLPRFNGHVQVRHRLLIVLDERGHVKEHACFTQTAERVFQKVGSTLKQSMRYVHKGRIVGTVSSPDRVCGDGVHRRGHCDRSLQKTLKAFDGAQMDSSFLPDY